MTFNGIHEALIIADDINDCTVMLAAIVEKMTRSFVLTDGGNVIINMRERGKELLQSAEDISEDMAAGKRADSFSLYRALENPRSIPREAELSLRRGDSYCGRLRLRCVQWDDMPDDEDIDAAAVVANGDEELPFSLLPAGAGLVIAAKCEQQPEPEGSSVEASRLTDGMRFFKGAYDPYGFINGTRHRADCAEPYGIEEIFRHLVLFAAQSRYDRLRKAISEAKKIIARRSGIFSRGSIRSYMELEKARSDYSAAVRDIYTSEQLIELTERHPFICGGQQ